MIVTCLKEGADAVVFRTCLYVGAAAFIREFLLYDESQKLDFIGTEEKFSFKFK